MQGTQSTPEDARSAPKRAEPVQTGTKSAAPAQGNDAKLRQNTRVDKVFARWAKKKYGLNGPKSEFGMHTRTKLYEEREANPKRRTNQSPGRKKKPSGKSVAAIRETLVHTLEPSATSAPAHDPTPKALTPAKGTTAEAETNTGGDDTGRAYESYLPINWTQQQMVKAVMNLLKKSGILVCKGFLLLLQLLCVLLANFIGWCLDSENYDFDKFMKYSFTTFALVGGTTNALVSATSGSKQTLPETQAERAEQTERAERLPPASPRHKSRRENKQTEGTGHSWRELMRENLFPILFSIAVIIIFAVIYFTHKNSTNAGGGDKPERRSFSANAASSIHVDVNSHVTDYEYTVDFTDMMGILYDFSDRLGVDASIFSALAMCTLQQHKDIIASIPLHTAICKHVQTIDKSTANNIQTWSANKSISFVRSMLLVLNNNGLYAALVHKTENMVLVPKYELTTSIGDRSVTLGVPLDDNTTQLLDLVDFLDRFANPGSITEDLKINSHSSSELVMISIINSYFERSDDNVPGIESALKGKYKATKNNKLNDLLTAYVDHYTKTMGMGLNEATIQSYKSHLQSTKYQTMIAKTPIKNKKRAVVEEEGDTDEL